MGVMPPAATSLDCSSNKNLAPDKTQRLSRSPHPYHRRHHDIKQDPVGMTERLSNGDTHKDVHNSPRSQAEVSPITYFDADHRKRRKKSSSPSDSGTEADDEKGAFLKGLPAPPLRPRKGLKGGYGSSSPLLTPSYLDDATRRAISEADARRRASVFSQASMDERFELREKYTKRRRAELARRITETLLLCAIVYIASNKAIQQVAFTKNREPACAISDDDCNWIPPTLTIYLLIVPGLYCLYPIRILIKNHTQSLSQNKAWYYIHIPAAFDPAVLLYPPVVPVVVALSLLRDSPKMILLNVCLSIASVPSKVVPLNNDVPWYSSMQWLLSAAPLLGAEVVRTYWLDNGEVSTSLPSRDNEGLSCVYLLHQALMPVLGYLTTTSLLPAELQLLSSALINLLLYSSSPQASILQALIWIGGLSLLLLCGKVLSWEVALARVPDWRFRKSRNHHWSRQDSGVMKVLDSSLNGRLSGWGWISHRPEDSDSDAPEVRPNSSARKIKTILSRIDTSGLGHARDDVKVTTTAPLSAIGDGPSPKFPNDRLEIEIPPALKTHHRRFTLPSYIGSSSEIIGRESPQRNKSARPKTPQAWSFRSLTAAQATLLSWGYAMYVYSIVLLLIALPIRQYIGKYALGGQEPVGWALGYMFGDLIWFQTIIKDVALDQWIPLPCPSASTHFDENSFKTTVSGQVAHPSNIRLSICVYCLFVIAAGLATVFQLSAIVEVDTRRKVFHGMMVLMFLPTIFVDPPFIALALTLILAIFLLLDLFRASQLPPLSKPLTYFLAPYVDGRDHRGPVIVSHIFLLIGCAIPLWLSLVATPRKKDSPWLGWEVEACDLSMTAGVVCVGMGDAAASLIGRRFGRRRWPWSGGKSLEGSLAFAVAVVVGLTGVRTWLLFGGWAGDSGDAWTTFLYKAAIAGCGASLTEAVLTGGNDNVIVPIILWLLVRGLEM